MLRLCLTIILLCPIVKSVRVMNESHLIDKKLIPMTKCYGNLGCFSTAAPFFDIGTRPINFLPQDRDVINTGFTLFTRMNKLWHQRIVTNDTGTLRSSFFDGKKKTRFIIHGFLEFGGVDWMNEMRIALLNAEDVNVIQVDWSGGSRNLYTQATANTRLVGAEVEHFIRFLERESTSGARRQDMHIIGHSLGAHTGGYAGERLGGQLGRISGMDPAGPYFEDTDPLVRLDPTDAIFVDAIHTDAHSIITLGFGIKQPVGHVDFYPNGGEEQTDCSRNPITQIIIEGITNGVKWVVACDHLRVYRLYTESITHTSCPFRGYPCRDYEEFQRGNCISCGSAGCAPMGHYTDRWSPQNGVTGVKMYLDTKDSKDFCRFHNVIRMETTDDPDSREERAKLYIILYGRRGISQELELTEKPTLIRGSSRYQYLIKLTESYGEIYRIVFKWTHEWTVTQPGTLPVFRTPKINISSIKVFVGIENAEYTFCGDGQGLTDGTLKSMYKSNSNQC